MRIENSQSNTKRIGTGQDKGNSQEETETFFDEQKCKAQQRKQSATFG